MASTGRVFVCHNSQEKAQVQEIALALLRLGGVRTWLDQWEMRGGTEWEEHLRNAFAESSACLVFVGPNGIGRYQPIEIQWVKERARPDPSYLTIPVILPGATDDGMAALEKSLPGVQWVSLQSGWASLQALTPLLAAIRGHRPGPPALAISVAVAAENWQNSARQDRSALLRGRVLEEARELAAQPGGFDELSLEFIAASEVESRHRQRWLVGGLGTLAAMFAGIALWANSQRLEAVSAREAESVARQSETVERQKAVEQRDIALSAQHAEAAARQEADKQRANADQQREVADTQAAEARRQRDNALQAARRNLADKLAAQSASLLLQNPQRALLLSAEAILATRPDKLVTPTARASLHRVLQLTSGNGLMGHADSIHAASFSFDETLLATASFDGELRVWNIADPKSVNCVSIMREASRADFLGFDRQSKYLISWALGREARPRPPSIWRIERGNRNPTPLELNMSLKPAYALALSDGEDLLAVAEATGKISLYSLRGGVPSAPIRTLSIPAGIAIKKMLFSADATALVAGTRSNRVLLWDLTKDAGAPVADFIAGHKKLGPFQDRELSIDLLDFNKDKTLLLTGVSEWSAESSFADPNIRVWKLNKLVPQGTPIVIDQALDENNKAVVTAFFDKDSNFLITTTLAGATKAWHVPSLLGDTWNPKAPAAQTSQVGFSHGAAHSAVRDVFAWGQNNMVSLIDTTGITNGNFKRIKQLRGFDGHVETVAMSKSGRFIAAGGIDRVVRLWDLHAIDPVNPSSSWSENPFVEAELVALGATGRIVVTVRGKILEVWDIAKLDSPKLLGKEQTGFEKKDFCRSCQVLLSPDERWLVVQDAEDKNRSKVFEVGSDGVKYRFTVNERTWNPTEEVRFSAGGEWLIVKESGRTVAYSLQSKSAVERKEVLVAEPGNWFHFVHSNDLRWAVVSRFMSDMDNDAEAGRASSGWLLPMAGSDSAEGRINIRGFPKGIGTVAFSRDSRWLAIAGASASIEHEHDDRKVQVWRSIEDQWSLVANLKPIEFSSQALRFSPDGRWLFTGSGQITLGDRNVSALIWNLQKPLTADSGQRLPNVTWNLKLAEISPDSRWLITVSGAEPYARLWDISGPTIRHVTRLVGPRPKLNNHWAVQFGPNASSIVLWTEDDATPYLWRLASGKSQEQGMPIPNGDRRIEKVQYSSDGSNLTILNSGRTTSGLSGSEGAHVTLVDLVAFPSEDSTNRFDIAGGAHTFVVRKDAGVILVGGEELRPVVWKDDDLLARAERIIGRNMTWDEWAKSGLPGRYRPTFPNLPVGADVIQALTGELEALERSRPTTDSRELTKRLVNWALQLGDGDACNGLGWEVALRGDATAALALSDCAVGASPANPNFHDTRAVALMVAGRRSEALTEFEYFLEYAQDIEQFAKLIPIRRGWVDKLRAGKDPFR